MMGNNQWRPWIVALLVAYAPLALRAADQPADAGAKDAKISIYIGTFTGPKSKGIYLLQMDLATGALSPPILAAKVERPSFLALHPSGRFVYAVGEVDNFEGKKTGALRALSIDPSSGKLTVLNEQPSGGAGPCYVSIDPEGKNALVANYTGGSVAVLPIDPDGKLRPATATDQHKGSGPDPKRQQGPFAHCFDLDPSHQFALACDLGMDKVFIYKFDPAQGSITPNDPPTASVAPGAGPRHLALHRNGKFVYVINEMGSTINAFAYDANKGALSEVQTVSTLPADFKGNNSTCAEVAVHPNGKFLYGSNRGHDSIASFSVDEQTGKLTLIGHQSAAGKTPRHFAIAPGGEFLVVANQDSGNVVALRIDAKTGMLTSTGMTAEVPSPVCVLFMPLGK